MPVARRGTKTSRGCLTFMPKTRKQHSSCLGGLRRNVRRPVRSISAAGHEIASHGHGHELVYSLQPSEFRADILRSKGLLKDLTGKQICGYRAPCFSITEWAVPILQEAGFRSLLPWCRRSPTIAMGDYMDPTSGNRSFSCAMGCMRFVSRACGLEPAEFHGPEGGIFVSFLWRFGQWGVCVIIKLRQPYVFYIHPWEMRSGAAAGAWDEDDERFSPTCQPSAL